MVPVAGSMVRPPLLLMLSKIRLSPPCGKVNRNSAAWSVGVISVRMPSSKVTP
jgi:hypothetical protein